MSPRLPRRNPLPEPILLPLPGENALFYKTEIGARVGDVFMSLIHAAELCEANPFD
jgi:hypothetical protein